jgi:cytochrome c oxidase assembly protein subunit 15
MPGSPASQARLVRRLALATLVGNVAIVLTGGAVRLTDSGLGCPTWPRCTGESWTATAEMGIHGLIENTNRGLGVVLGAVALAGFLATLRLRPRRPALGWLAGAVLAGIAGQGVVGGVTVLTGLNPWVVGAHFLVSIAIIAAAHAFWRRAGEPDGPVRLAGPAPLRRLAWLIVAVAVALLALGTVVTGSGPHAGDAEVARNGLDPERLSQAHAQLAFLLLGLAVAGWFAVRAGAAGAATRWAATGLVAAIAGQGAVGLVQYATGLPEPLVWLHLLGSCLVWLAALELLHSTRTRLAGGPAAVPDRELLAAG